MLVGSDSVWPWSSKNNSAADPAQDEPGVSPEKAEKIARRFLAQIGGTLDEGILLLDPADRVRWASPAAARLLRVAPERFGEDAATPLIEATHSVALVRVGQQARVSGQRREEQIGLVGPAADTVLRVRAVPLLPPLAPSPDHLLLILSDQTELSRLRTVRTEFVANVSHELRTPLASIRAMAETLQDGALHDPDAAHRFLETIVRETDRLVALSADLLELARAESTAQTRETFDLSQLLHDVASRLRGQAERRRIQMRVDAPEPLWVTVDRGQLDQVVFNLLDNAVKYTPEGGEVTACASRDAGSPSAEESPEGPVARLTVTDTGIGILAGDLPRIFERFWRADRARRFAGGQGTSGTGLGLSIVKHIVEAHGGTVTAHSELGHGSQFAVTLPRDVSR